MKRRATAIVLHSNRSPAPPPLIAVEPQSITTGFPILLRRSIERKARRRAMLQSAAPFAGLVLLVTIIVALFIHS